MRAVCCLLCVTYLFLCLMQGFDETKDGEFNSKCQITRKWHKGRAIKCVCVCVHAPCYHVSQAAALGGAVLPCWQINSSCGVGWRQTQARVTHTQGVTLPLRVRARHGAGRSWLPVTGVGGGRRGRGGGCGRGGSALLSSSCAGLQVRHACCGHHHWGIVGRSWHWLWAQLCRRRAKWFWNKISFHSYFYITSHVDFIDLNQKFGLTIVSSIYFDELLFFSNILVTSKLKTDSTELAAFFKTASCLLEIASGCCLLLNRIYRGVATATKTTTTTLTTSPCDAICRRWNIYCFVFIWSTRLTEASALDSVCSICLFICICTQKKNTPHHLSLA